MIYYVKQMKLMTLLWDPTQRKVYKGRKVTNHIEVQKGNTSFTNTSNKVTTAAFNLRRGVLMAAVCEFCLMMMDEMSLTQHSM